MSSQHATDDDDEGLDEAEHFRCESCERLVPYEMGTDDDELCDDCALLPF